MNRVSKTRKAMSRGVVALALLGAQLASVGTSHADMLNVGSWSSISVSDDGNYILVGSFDGHPAQFSTDAGVSWNTPSIPATTDWTWFEHAAMSADGSLMMISSYAQSTLKGKDLKPWHSGAWFSRDYGKTWKKSSLPSGPGYTALLMSANGKFINAFDFRNVSTSYRSADGGLTWKKSSDYAWLAGMSRDGKNVVKTSITQIYHSTDYAATWKERSISSNTYQIRAIRCDDDCSTIVAPTWSSNAGGKIYFSHNGGVSWTVASAPKEQWESAGVSGDGKVMIAGAYGKSGYISRDGGKHWSELVIDGQDRYTGIAMNHDGSKIWISSSYQNVIRSEDSGKTWVVL